MAFPQLIESKLDSVGLTYKADSSWRKACLKNLSFINAFETCFSYLRGQGVFPNKRCMDNLFLNRTITPEADKTRSKGS